MSESASTPLQLQTSKPNRILVVENDPFLLHFSAEVLIRHGYEVNGAEDGAAAWEELRAVNYNLLIIDYTLPRLTGIGLIKKLRAAHLALPVVLVAEKLPTRQLAKYPPLQPAATLLKPIAVDTLLETVNIVLRTTISPFEEIAVRANAITQVLRESLNGYSGYSHWGLNE
jgi:DNA-binding response OmpR family regulator